MGRIHRERAVGVRAEGRATPSRAGTALRSACILQLSRSCAQLSSRSDEIGTAWWPSQSRAREMQFPRYVQYGFADLETIYFDKITTESSTD